MKPSLLRRLLVLFFDEDAPAWPFGDVVRAYAPALTGPSASGATLQGPAASGAVLSASFADNARLV